MAVAPTITGRKSAKARPRYKEKIIVGWREKVALPDLGIDQIKAKIDTGARTSALHAFRIKTFRRGKRRIAKFYVHPVQHRREPELLCEARIVDERVVTSSNGKQEHRYVVETLLQVGGTAWPIEITLTNRDEMGFRMLLGRQALRRRAIVDPGSSYKLDKKKRKSRHSKGETKR